jgi:pyruvoyl-dependent arginine decarboxylase (PvlArgDC)
MMMFAVAVVGAQRQASSGLSSEPAKRMKAQKQQTVAKKHAKSGTMMQMQMISRLEYQRDQSGV